MGIHYPGARVRFNGQTSTTPQRIVVYDTISAPSPLIAEQHEFEIHAETGVLTIVERIVIANRSLHSYVGATSGESQSPVTLRLSIPPEFDKVTFDKEFFGREFHLNERRLETSIPWTPGKHELKFTYRLPLVSGFSRFHRPMDLPTEQARVTVARQLLGDVTCNLSASPSSDGTMAVFITDGEGLQAGQTLEVALGSVPIRWTDYARWGALAVLLLLIAGTCVYAL
jgi:hypothetical protein